jgi:hypothetical protein
MSQLTKYLLKDASDAEDNGSWFLDSLLDLLDQGKQIIKQHLSRLAKIIVMPEEPLRVSAVESKPATYGRIKTSHFSPSDWCAILRS